MLEVVLTYSAPDGPQEIVVDRERTSFGRGSEADYRFPDDGLSRLHATIYREGDRVWIIDNNSTNGTFVNGAQVSGQGTPLKNGDIVRIGNHTNLGVRVINRQAAVSKPNVKAAALSSTAPVAQAKPSVMGILPVVLIAGAIFVIAI